MVFAISTPTSSLLHSSSASSGAGKVSSLCSIYNSTISIPRNAILLHIRSSHHLSSAPLAQWNGLRHVGISVSKWPVNMERKGKCKGRGVYASLFGIGAPEVLVIGVVALLVFGPKGLAEVARNLGQTIRAFQPTIRELQEVSRDFKSTLQREIGLDDINTPVPPSPISNITKPPSEMKTEDSEAAAPPPSSETGEVGSTDEYLRVKADKFRGALAQLQKEQEAERDKNEIEEAQSQATLQTPSPDTPTQSLDTPTQDASLVGEAKEASENSNNEVLLQVQEAAAPAVTTGSSPTAGSEN